MGPFYCVNYLYCFPYEDTIIKENVSISIRLEYLDYLSGFKNQKVNNNLIKFVEDVVLLFKNVE